MVIDGKQLAQEIIEELKKERENILKKIRLAVVLVGSDPASLSFIKQKEKIAQELKIDFRIYQKEETIKNDELRKSILQVALRKTCGGVIVQ
ncbi:MAG: tetrahydrofolate dehydrogenase/cyclohydrolase catalytic domain-containing protein, partial [Minisyncoccia bacterium]